LVPALARRGPDDPAVSGDHAGGQLAQVPAYLAVPATRTKISPSSIVGLAISASLSTS
jgi:hypothetical protein